MISNLFQCLVPLLRMADHAAFKETVLPAMQKAMLRNPEIVLESIGSILAGLNIDLSQYVADVSKHQNNIYRKKKSCSTFQLSKHLGANLHAKDDDTRSAAVEAVAALASQCSDAEALSSLVKALFAVLGGSEGKLTVNAHKCSLLAALGKVATCANAVSATSVQGVCVQVFDFAIKVWKE